MKALMATWPQAGMVEEAASGLEAIQCIEEAQPDLVMMDVQMPEIDGLEATRLIKERWPEIKVVVLSMYPDYTANAVAAGADAFVSKGEPPEKLLATLAILVSGENE